MYTSGKSGLQMWAFANLADGNPPPSLYFFAQPPIFLLCAAVGNEKWIQFEVKHFFL